MCIRTSLNQEGSLKMNCSGYPGRKQLTSCELRREEKQRVQAFENLLFERSARLNRLDSFAYSYLSINQPKYK